MYVGLGYQVVKVFENKPNTTEVGSHMISTSNVKVSLPLPMTVGFHLLYQSRLSILSKSSSHNIAGNLPTVTMNNNNSMINDAEACHQDNYKLSYKCIVASSIVYVS